MLIAVECATLGHRSLISRGLLPDSGDATQVIADAPIGACQPHEPGEAHRPPMLVENPSR